MASSVDKFWKKGPRWYIIDSHRPPRCVFRKCLRSEAQSAAHLVFLDEALKAVSWHELTYTQRAVAKEIPMLTLARCRELFGVEIHPDHEKRRMKQEKRRAPTAPIYPLPGEFLSKAGGAQ